MSEERSSPPQITGSSSGRQSKSPIQSALASWIAATHNERVRASSWDDSDEESPVKPEKTVSQSRRLYSADAKKNTGSVASEINELKKQFFESLKNEDQKSENELVKDAVEAKINYDRRQSPARIRRRSSSSSSPVREPVSQVSSQEKELDQISLRSVDYDTKFYLNHFFAELKSKQVGRDDAAGKVEEGPIYDSECVEMYNQLNNWEGRDAEGFLCKTSRKLSQILEVEENRKDLDKKSEENLDFFRRNFKSPEDLSPLETARSTKGDKLFESLRHGQIEERFKPLNFDDFGNFHATSYPTLGNLSERTGSNFRSKIQDDFISLSAKTGTTHLISPISDESDAPFQYFCFANPMGFKNFPREIFPKDKGKNSESNDSLKNVLMGNCKPKKSEENRSERHPERVSSGKSKAGNLESPKFMLSIDSARSLKVEDLDTPDSAKKNESGKRSTDSLSNSKSQKSVEAPSFDALRQSRENSTRSNTFGLDDVTKANSNSSRSDSSFEKNAERNLASPDSCRSIGQQEPTPPSSRGQKPREELIKESIKTPGSSRGNRKTQKDSKKSLKHEKNSPKPDAATWRELIDAFQGTSNRSFNLENHFPGFPRQKKNFRDWEREIIDNKPEDEPQESTDARLLGNDSLLDASMKEADENLKNRNLDYKECLLEKIQKEEGAGPLQTSQNLFYFNVDERGPFGIGEFGDVTYCTAGNSDTVDFGKPKDHGDGIPTEKSQGVIALASEKREKDGKSQRQLWTELRRDSRGTEDAYFPRYIPIGMKTSKSDNFINARTLEDILVTDESLSVVKVRNVEKGVPEFEKVRKETKSTSKTASECSRSESWCEDLENPELDCERTPRLSKSLPDIRYPLPKDGKDRRTVEPFESATSNYDEWKEPEILSLILTCKKEEEKTKNWLSLKNSDRKENRKRAKKWKTKQKKKETSPKEPFHEYLSVRKSRQPVPPLKLRNSNCFQNFYKRFISVFCLTSNSSAATSK